VLGQQRNAWPAVLDALNDKIPEGVWITQLTPAFDPRRAAGATGERPRGGFGGRPPEGGEGAAGGHPPEGLGGYATPTDQINVLVINGLYQSNDKTEKVDPARLGDFVQALSDLPQFDIDPKKQSETLVSFETPETNPNVFAEQFSMHVKLKQPIELTP